MTRERAGRWALAAASVGATLLLGEAALRFFDWGPELHPVSRENYRLSDDPALRYELLPGSRDGAFRINAAGMRDRERALRKPANTFRIACLGDSITYGFGVAQPETFPAQLERILNERGGPTRYEVLNFGVTGYDLSQSVRTLRVRALDYAPDLVIFQYCLNDPESTSFEWEALLASLPSAEADYWEQRAGGRRLLRSSRLLALARYALRSRAATGGGGRAPRPDAQWAAIARGSWAEYYARLHTGPETWPRVERGLDELRAVARAAGVPAAVVVFPVFLDLERYPLRAVHERVRDAARSRSLAVLDLLDTYAARAPDEGDDLAVNALHPSARGHELAARALAAWLLERGLLAAEPASRAAPEG